VIEAAVSKKKMKCIEERSHNRRGEGGRKRKGGGSFGPFHPRERCVGKEGGSHGKRTKIKSGFFGFGGLYWVIKWRSQYSPHEGRVGEMGIKW